MEKVFVEFAENCGTYDNIVMSLKMFKEEIPLTGDTVDLYPKIIDRKILSRRLNYQNGRIEEVRLYLR